jgi:hypothetical protein
MPLPTQSTPNATQGGTGPSCVPFKNKGVGGATFYGCYCGKGTTCTSGNTCTPTDALDAACQQHDIGYGSCIFPGIAKGCFTKTGQADARLCDSLINLQGQFAGRAEQYRSSAEKLFCNLATLKGFGPLVCSHVVATHGEHDVTQFGCDSGQTCSNGQCISCSPGTVCGKS